MPSGLQIIIQTDTFE